MKKLIHLTVLLFSLPILAQEWYDVPSNTKKKLNAICFASDSVGYIGGNDSTLLKTTDGGRSWQHLIHSGINYNFATRDFIHLEFLDDHFGYAILSASNLSGTLYQTADGGTTWALVSTVSMCFPKTSHFFDKDNGVIAGLDCFWNETLQRYVAGSFGPVQHLDINMGALSCIDFLNTSFGLAGGQSSYIMRTTDGGVTWDSVQTYQFGRTISDIEIVNDTLAYATYPQQGGTGLIFSTDAGLTWMTETNSATFYYPGLEAVTSVPDGRFYAVGSQSSGWSIPPPNGYGYIIYKTVSDYRFHLVEQHVYDVASYGDSTVFTVGDSGQIITNLDTTMISNSIVKNEVADFKIYPNPVQNELYIESHNAGLFQITISDIRGVRHIQTSSASLSNYILDVHTLNPGIYIVTIQHAGGQQSMKFIKQ